MTAALARPLADLRLGDVGQVGGKAASLGELLAAGLRVPDGVVLTAEGGLLTAADRASVIDAAVRAREYGIPAVVGCGDATVRLQTGMRVVVDGGRGNVEPG